MRRARLFAAHAQRIAGGTPNRMRMRRVRFGGGGVGR